VLAAPAPAQSEPRNGIAPRLDAGTVAADVERLPHTLLGWCGADGLPEVVPAGVQGAGAGGVVIRAPRGKVPAGGRRAGLTSHMFQPKMIGQEQRVHTGWLSAGDDGTITYAPHSRAGYRLPPSKIVYTIGCAALTARRRAARNAGYG